MQSDAFGRPVKQPGDHGRLELVKAKLAVNANQHVILKHLPAPARRTLGLNLHHTRPKAVVQRLQKHRERGERETHTPKNKINKLIKKIEQ
jgi:hypothetical protein